MSRSIAIALKCPVCHRDVAPARPHGGEGAELARELFVRHADRQHGVGELEGLLFYAEALRRRPKL